jgi:hypothetical protein
MVPSSSFGVFTFLGICRLFCLVFAPQIKWVSLSSLTIPVAASDQIHPVFRRLSKQVLIFSCLVQLATLVSVKRRVPVR